MTYDAFDVVVVPFPFTEGSAARRRPAVVLSDAQAAAEAGGHCALAMITSRAHAPWALDVPIADLEKAGLPSGSVVRLKLFSLDERLILRKAGRLGKKDRDALRQSLGKLFDSAVARRKGK